MYLENLNLFKMGNTLGLGFNSVFKRGWFSYGILK
jgi:hypothetical protein